MTASDMTAPTDAPRRDVLEAFERALRREAHNLCRWPDLTWQQLHNRLQWEGDPVEWCLASQWDRRSNTGATPWIRTRVPFRESRALIRTLTGHLHWVNACSFSPDGSRIASAGEDKTVKLWDARTGVELATLRGHASGVNNCAFSPDGMRIVSAGTDTTLRLWDVQTGAQTATLTGHTGDVHACTGG